MYIVHNTWTFFPKKISLRVPFLYGNVEIPLFKGGGLRGGGVGGLPHILYQCANNNNWDHHQKEYYRHTNGCLKEF